MGKYIFVALSAALLGCLDSGEPVPPTISIQELLAAPDTVVVEGRTLTLSTSIWRDFMPISPPDGKPLIAAAYIDAVDTTRLPSSITSDAIWIAYDGQVWNSHFTNETPPQQRPNRLEKIARNGPKWGPGVYVDVVVRVFDGRGIAVLLGASHQCIGRTD